MAVDCLKSVLNGRNEGVEFRSGAGCRDGSPERPRRSTSAGLLVVAGSMGVANALEFGEPGRATARREHIPTVDSRRSRQRNEIPVSHREVR